GSEFFVPKSAPEFFVPKSAPKFFVPKSAPSPGGKDFGKGAKGGNDSFNGKGGFNGGFNGNGKGFPPADMAQGRPQPGPPPASASPVSKQ
ncbi:unnamed protein product, partial [Polarella glacialis]